MVVNVILHCVSGALWNWQYSQLQNYWNPSKEQAKKYIGKKGITLTDSNLPVIWENEKDKKIILIRTYKNEKQYCCQMWGYTHTKSHHSSPWEKPKLSSQKGQTVVLPAQVNTWLQKYILLKQHTITKVIIKMIKVWNKKLQRWGSWSYWAHAHTGMCVRLGKIQRSPFQNYTI